MEAVENFMVKVTAPRTANPWIAPVFVQQTQCSVQTGISSRLSLARSRSAPGDRVYDTGKFEEEAKRRKEQARKAQQEVTKKEDDMIKAL
jgi:hypothetical protein